MTRILDPQRLRLTRPSRPSTAGPPSKAWRPRRRELFLKGPISWTWLSTAAQLPGRALHVALAIQLWVGIKRSNRIALSISKLAALGVGRHAAYRALKSLEQAGLVTVDRHVGRKPWVRVSEVKDGSPARGELSGTSK